jgi:hypothetical protein
LKEKKKRKTKKRDMMADITTTIIRRESFQGISWTYYTIQGNLRLMRIDR